jgi:quinol-cytochrome oxidoreductase complex cytochrome b subunit
MRRERALKVVLVVVGLIFIAGIYPLITSVRDGWRANKEDPLPMGISLYVTQGIFLLLAARDPLANRGVITFAAWLNIAHAGVMTVMAIHLPNERQDLLVASAVFGAIGAVLITLPPRTQPAKRVATQENLPRDLPPTFLQKR